VHFSEVLSTRGISLVMLRHTISSATGSSPADPIYLAGSLVEGLGNAQSDLDAYAITDEEPLAACLDRVVVTELAGLSVDIEVWRPAEVELLVTKLIMISDSADAREALALSLPEIEFLHRLAGGVPLQGNPVADHWKYEISTRMPGILIDRSLVIADGHHLDCVGSAEIGDLITAALVAQQMVDTATDALLAALGGTSCAPKWRYKRLTKIQQSAFDLGIPGSDDRTIADEYINLSLSKDATLDRLDRLISASIRYTNRVIPWAQQVGGGEEFLRKKGELSPALALEENTAESRLLPRLSRHSIIRFDRKELLLSRLDRGPTISITPSFHEAVSWFDGETRESTAVSRLRSLTMSDVSTLTQSLRDIENLLRWTKMIE
jgi:hypothetical protein